MPRKKAQAEAGDGRRYQYDQASPSIFRVDRVDETGCFVTEYRPCLGFIVGAQDKREPAPPMIFEVGLKGTAADGPEPGLLGALVVALSLDHKVFCRDLPTETALRGLLQQCTVQVEQEGEKLEGATLAARLQPWDTVEPGELPREWLPEVFHGLGDLKQVPLRPTAEKAKPKRRTPPLEPLAADGYLRMRSDRICKAVVEALAPDAIRKLDPDEWKKHGILPGDDWDTAYPFSTGRKDPVRGVVGFSQKPSTNVWDTLQRNGPLAVKAQYALMDRAYIQTGGEPGAIVTLSVPEFCDDLGFTRHKGSHRAERKRESVRVLELMTSLEVSASYITPSGTNRRLRGPIWMRGHIAEKYDGYADLFGANRTGDPDLWEPTAFSYAPGRFFGDAEWRKYNNRVARVGAGLMKLRTDKDQWAIMVGGYLGTISRMNGYRDSFLKVQTLLERTGLARADPKHPGRQIDKLEAALDKVQEVGIIDGWEYTDTVPEDDMDDPDDLEKIIQAADRRELKRIRITWPADLPEIKPGPEALGDARRKK
jgi:hypothetical protein